jgi:ribonuclease VapC
VIVVDTSAIVAILRKEPEGPALLTRLNADDQPCMAAATFLETCIVLRCLDRPRAAITDATLDAFMTEAGVDVMSVTRELASVARAAHGTYGKGAGHGAALNFGDCLSYALAKSLDVPLLYKGSDFAKTDIVSAL